MRGLLLFTVAAANEDFDNRTIEMLSSDQINHKAVYHMERIHVRVGMPEDRLLTEGELCWEVRTNAYGEMLAPKNNVDVSACLSTYLFGKIVKNQDTACSAVFVSSGDPAAGVGLLQVSAIVSQQLSKLFPVRAHIIFLQNQYAHHESGVIRLMQRIKQFDSLTPALCSSLYMLPWDNEETKASSRETILTLIKTMMAAQQDPMILPGISKPNWIETATVRRLNAPVECITNVVFKYLTDDFLHKVLNPALHPDGVPMMPAKDLQDCVRTLESFLSDVESKHMLPSFEELLCVMPERDPVPMRKLDEDISVERAWDAIYNIYGKSKGAELKSRLSPSIDELEDQYRQIGLQLSVELTRNVIALARGNDQGVDVQQLVGQVGEKLLSRMKDHGAKLIELPKYDGTLLLSRNRKEAIRKAKQRHFYLWKVYVAAARKLSEERKRLRGEMVREAIRKTQQYLHDCLTQLEARYLKMCAIFLSRQVEHACYINQLDEAYKYWCAHTEAIRCPGADDLYDLFDDDVLRMDTESVADTLCGRLEDLFKRCTEEAIDTIRVKIGSFFSELNFRSELLGLLGLTGNLNESLLDYLLKHPGNYSPLLCQKKAGEPMCIRAKALIFYSDGNASAFANLAAGNNIEVVNDPYEKGVQMIVKYAGEALEDVLVYIHNQSERESGA